MFLTSGAKAIAGSMHAGTGSFLKRSARDPARSHQIEKILMGYLACSGRRFNSAASRCSASEAVKENRAESGRSSQPPDSLQPRPSSLSSNDESLLMALSRPSPLSTDDEPPLTVSSADEESQSEVPSHQAGMQEAFYNATFNVKAVSPWAWLHMGLRDEPFAEIFHDQRFLTAWGYASEEEMGKIIGCVDETGKPDVVAREFYKPLRRWALHGKIDRAQFCELKQSYRFRMYLNLFHADALTVDQLWKIAELYCDTGKEAEIWRDTSLTGVVTAYGRGTMTFDELRRFFQSITGGYRYAEVVPELLESGALSKEWGKHEDLLKRWLHVLDAALGDFADPTVCGLCFAPGDSWDREVARNYFGVKDVKGLSQIKLTQKDLERANHSKGAVGAGVYVGASVTWTLQGNQGANLLLATEVRRRLERERAAGAREDAKSGSKMGAMLISKIKPPCVLY